MYKVLVLSFLLFLLIESKLVTTKTSPLFGSIVDCMHVIFIYTIFAIVVPYFIKCSIFDESFINCHHCTGEWISSAVCLWLINEFVTGHSRSRVEVVNFLNQYQFHILPFANPDGYEFTRNVVCKKCFDLK